MGSNPAQGNYSFPQKLSSVEFPITFSLSLSLYIYIYIYIYKKESITSYSSFTLKAIITLGVVYEKISFISVQIGCHEELVFVAAFRYQLRFLV